MKVAQQAVHRFSSRIQSRELVQSRSVLLAKASRIAVRADPIALRQAGPLLRQYLCPRLRRQLRTQSIVNVVQVSIQMRQVGRLQMACSTGVEARPQANTEGRDTVRNNDQPVMTLDNDLK